MNARIMILTYSQAWKILNELLEVKGWSSNAVTQNINKVPVAAVLKKWKPREGNSLEINVDCAFIGEIKKATISMAIRDKMGILIDGVFQICDATSVLMGEFMSLGRAF